MEAALLRRETALAETPDLPLRFSISIAAGEVMFGNVGVPARLSFSVIGAVVNEVARMDDASKILGRAVLVTKEIAAVEPECWASLGPQVLAGVPQPVELFIRRCERDAFSADYVRAAS